MNITVMLSIVLVLATISIHFEVLRWTSLLLPRFAPAGRARVLLVVLGAFSAHIVEVLLYAGAFFVLEHGISVGQLGGSHGKSLMDYFYYSMVMFTSLGLGDVFPVGHLRVLSAIEALNGLVLIGWSTSFTFLAMRSYWPLDPGLQDKQSDP